MVTTIILLNRAQIIVHSNSEIKVLNGLENCIVENKIWKMYFIILLVSSNYICDKNPDNDLVTETLFHFIFDNAVGSSVL